MHFSRLSNSIELETDDSPTLRIVKRCKEECASVVDMYWDLPPGFPVAHCNFVDVRSVKAVNEDQTLTL